MTKLQLKKIIKEVLDEVSSGEKFVCVADDGDGDADRGMYFGDRIFILDRATLMKSIADGNKYKAIYKLGEKVTIRSSLG